MKKDPLVQVPETFWNTPEGAPLYHTLHRDGWDAIDMLNSVKKAFDKAIAETQNDKIRAELEKSRDLLIRSRKTYRDAVNRLRDQF